MSKKNERQNLEEVFKPDGQDTTLANSRNQYTVKIVGTEFNADEDEID